ncbi:antiviral protein [Grosmannia clavigera kw1407]|uniref:Antiviral protein n=1 Tax=Grosmannia clavigera (strain kw1407 / UAMH 11150) TaxID=655863 RepID=F0XND3_GROCL|nr:antiviral protein [Grosmannia clavigera kw1407]EFX00944.1 antiviral protein [Grosmannia clavigera kw1407]
MAGAKKPGSSQQGAKAQLKAIGEALRQQKYDEAIQQARDVLEADSKNYQALIFLGFALDKTGKLDDAVPVYEDAASVKPADPQAWQGLIKVFEKQGSRAIPKYKLAAIKLAEIYSDAEDMYKCQVVVDTFVDFSRANASGKQLVDALGILLPDSPVYPILRGRIQPPATTYTATAKVLEADEAMRINTLIGERRTRLGARLVEVTAEVKRDTFADSQLTDIYGELINWTNDDELRRSYEEKLLSYRVERLAVFVGDKKEQELEEVRKLAKGMVIIKHPFQLAWEITIDWCDFADVSDWDVALLWEFYTLFPTSGLGKALGGFLTSELSPFSQKAPPEEDAGPQADSEGGKESEGAAAKGGGEKAEGDAIPTVHDTLPKTDEDRLAFLLDGIKQAKSLLAYRMAGIWYQHSEDFLDNIELMRKALKFLDVRRADTGLSLQNTEDAFTVYLATALIYYQRPRNHPESKQLFERVLSHNPEATPALVGVGLIDEEELDYGSAVSFLERALERDRSDLRVRSEAAWVRSLRGEHEHARSELEACIPLLVEAGVTVKKLLALTQYRLGVCMWHLDGSKAARKSRNGAYKQLLNALKNDLHLAPAYTSLGIYYADYGKDRKRAYKCFMKALELSSGELEAGRRLVQTFADKRDWESIELVAQRVVESGQATPPWGSKKKAHSWPFAALGTAQLHKKEYNKAMMSFRMATRLDPRDYHSFVALAETYLRVRMHYSAVRAIEQARKIKEGGGLDTAYDDWFTDFLLANVYRGVGEYDKATELYEAILQQRSDEPGVLIAMMHAMVESADSCVKRGLFGEATSKAGSALELAAKVATTQTASTSGFWTAVASACAVFSTVQGRVSEFPVALCRELIAGGEQGQGPLGSAAYSFLQDIDGVGTGVVAASEMFAESEKAGVDLTRCLHATILAFKRALHFTDASERQMLAAAHYNVGWAEYRAHSCLPTAIRSGLNGYLRAAIRCFKRAIELEGGNRRFWNGLGVATSAVHPPISQHALARSLYLGRGRAAVWANYGTLALEHGDVELANRAFAEGQSSDPDSAASWLGQGFVALAFGEADEAGSLAMHAMDLSDASSLAARQQYAISVFDRLTANEASTSSTADLVRPLIGLEQVRRLRPQELPYGHLFALFRERISDADGTTKLLEGICAALEADYEATESAASLRRYAVAKADVARAYVALGAYEKAVESGEMALQLVGEGGAGEVSKPERAKIRLSAHLSSGLAHFFRSAFDEALAEFEAVLGGDDDDDDKNPDAVCLFAQVLWASGTDEGRQRAQDELFAVIEAHPDHMQAVLLLGAMAMLNGDGESAEAVVAELAEMQTQTRSQSRAAAGDQTQMGNLMHALASLDGRQKSRHQAQRDIMLQPHLPHGWGNLGEEEEEGKEEEDDDDDDDDDEQNFACDMALRLTRSLIPPRGNLRPEDLARACVGTRRTTDAQVSIAVAPWLQDGWQALAEAVV